VDQIAGDVERENLRAAKQHELAKVRAPVFFVGLQRSTPR